MIKPFRLNIRRKVIMSMLTVVMFMGIACMIIGRQIIYRNIVEQANDNVKNDLNTAEYILNEKMLVKHRFFDYQSSLPNFQEYVLNRDRVQIRNKLEDLKRELDLDILNVTDSAGRIIVRSHNFALYGDDVSGDAFVKYAITNKKYFYGTDIITKDELGKEGEDLVANAKIPIVETPHARKKGRKTVEDALVIKAISPIIKNGEVIGTIYGAKILNNNYELVDKFKSLVFKDEKIDGVEVGTATIFLDDVRISTNVKTVEGKRAVGTQVSERVYRRVVEEGHVWMDEAFVVHDWYLTAYSPIYNIDRKIIGILYVGILKEKYNRIQRVTTMYFLLIIFLASVVAFGLAMYLIVTIFRPANVLIAASKDIIKGNYRKIEIMSRDEMGYICYVFNNMVDAILERDKKLQEQTQKQIIESEKLASLGRLASGIAHEVNNPLTGVLTYASLLLEDLKGSKHQDDLLVIVNETLRCRKIVKGILDFARVTQLEEQDANINDIINDVLSILERHVNFQNIMIDKRLNNDIPKIRIDINQIKSVINNLAVNAADAMASGGTLTITSGYSADGKRIVLKFIDTGSGISEENLSKIFDPFFTTKEPGKGTGLGLAVTYGIIKRHNGSIQIQSQVGKGTEITIELPIT